MYHQTPGAKLHYEVRGSANKGSGTLIVLVGAPMDARSFEPIAEVIAPHHTVLTTDPRGINRSTVDDRERDSTPELRADDLARLITHVDAGPAVVFGSSGGAVSTLALVQQRPDLVHTAIVHEPPLSSLLDDRAELRAQTEDVIATHRSGDAFGAGKKFLAMANIHLPDEAVEQIFAGDRDEQAIADADFQNTHMLIPTAFWEPDIDALRAASTRIIVGIGEQSAGQLCERTSQALADRLGIEPTRFPGDHIGFVGDPVAFATRIREVLTA